MNPVDVKVRQSAARTGEGWNILGWDAAGVIMAVGPDVTAFQAGDEVFYAGSIARAVANSELHLVDERIVARKPRKLDWAEAAALPLTSITAWEAMFDRLDVRKPVPGAAMALLVICGAGGVGSIAIQLARQLTDLTIIATASRPETRDWVNALGAHHTIDRRQPLAQKVDALGLGAPAFVFSTTQTEQHLADIAELIAPQGRFALIDDPATLDALPFKCKSVLLHWELGLRTSASRAGCSRRCRVSPTPATSARRSPNDSRRLTPKILSAPNGWWKAPACAKKSFWKAGTDVLGDHFHPCAKAPRQDFCIINMVTGDVEGRVLS